MQSTGGCASRHIKVAFIVLLLGGAILPWAIPFPSGRVANQKKGRVTQEDYVAEILTWRRARDEEFRNLKWSPLAVVAIAPLGDPKTTIGSGKEANLRLEADDVAPIHAEVVRKQDSDGKATFRLRSIGGKVYADSEPSAPLAEIEFGTETRVRIGHLIVYWDNLGTFGAVVRALDYTTPAFTHFKGLSYYPPDPRYRVQANVIANPKPKRQMVVDTHGWKRPAWRYGEAEFKLKGRELRLVLMLFSPKPRPNETFFIAFTDETRGKETYPAARYLQPPFVASGSLLLDFNLATNPLCAYNQGFACPLPPRENRLPIPIRAGEKIYPFAADH